MTQRKADQLFFWFLWTAFFTTLYVSKQYLHPPTYEHYQGMVLGWIFGMFMVRAHRAAYR